MTDIKRLRELAMGATPGERRVDRTMAKRYPSINGAPILAGDTIIARVPHKADKPIYQKEADAELIAACSPDALLRLLAVVEAAQAWAALYRINVVDMGTGKFHEREIMFSKMALLDAVDALSSLSAGEQEKKS